MQALRIATWEDWRNAVRILVGELPNPVPPPIAEAFAKLIDTFDELSDEARVTTLVTQLPELEKHCRGCSALEGLRRMARIGLAIWIEEITPQRIGNGISLGSDLWRAKASIVRYLRSGTSTYSMGRLYAQVYVAKPMNHGDGYRGELKAWFRLAKKLKLCGDRGECVDLRAVGPGAASTVYEVSISRDALAALSS